MLSIKHTVEKKQRYHPYFTGFTVFLEHITNNCRFYIGFPYSLCSLNGILTTIKCHRHLIFMKTEYEYQSSESMRKISPTLHRIKVHTNGY